MVGRTANTGELQRILHGPQRDSPNPCSRGSMGAFQSDDHATLTASWPFPGLRIVEFPCVRRVAYGPRAPATLQARIASTFLNAATGVEDPQTNQEQTLAIRDS